MIDGIHVVCCRSDAWLAEICVQSIRYWYPDIPVVVLKDTYLGGFSLHSLDRFVHVECRDLSREWGSTLGKLELLYNADFRRFLMLDADTCFVGPVLDDVSRDGFDFVVQAEHADPRSDWFRTTHYDIDRVREMDPSWGFPGYGVNSGQMICTRGVVREEDIRPFLRMAGDMPELADPRMFSLDQGLLCYLLTKLAAEGRLTIRPDRLMLWSGRNLPGYPEMPTVGDLQFRKRECPLVAHWAGCIPRPGLGVRPRLASIRAGHVLGFYAAMLSREKAFGVYRFAVSEYLRRFLLHAIRCAKTVRELVRH